MGASGNENKDETKDSAKATKKTVAKPVKKPVIKSVAGSTSKAEPEVRTKKEKVAESKVDSSTPVKAAKEIEAKVDQKEDDGEKRAVAHVKYIRISPRKVTLVLNLIRNKPLKLAMAILKYTPKAACEYLIKLLKSASANAENNNHMDVEKLYVSECFVTPGPILKRSRAKDHGRCHRILKRSSHVTIALKEKVEIN